MLGIGTSPSAHQTVSFKKKPGMVLKKLGKRFWKIRNVFSISLFWFLQIDLCFFFDQEHFFQEVTVRPPGGQHCPGWIDDGDPIVWAENEATRSFLTLRIFLKHQNGLEVGSRSRNLRFYEKKFNFLKEVDFFGKFFRMKYDENRSELWFLVVKSEGNIGKTWKYDEK